MERELLHCAFISIYVTDLPVLQESSNAQRHKKYNCKTVHMTCGSSPAIGKVGLGKKIFSMIKAWGNPRGIQVPCFGGKAREHCRGDAGRTGFTCLIHTFFLKMYLPWDGAVSQI